MEAELRVDRTSLTKAARGMRDAAGVFASDTDVLMSAVAGGGNSPWGDGTIGIVMNQINEMVGQACRHLSTRLHQSSTCIEAMREHHSTGEQASTALFPPIDQHADSPLHGARPEPGHSFLP